MALPGNEFIEGTGQHVLYVDDEPRLARLEERRLTQLGYRVTLAENGKAALAAFLVDPSAFDVVVTDFTMPGMNGLDLAREMTRVRPELPVIMSTGNTEDFPPGTVAEAGVRRMILKPIRMHEISLALAEVLGILPGD